MLLILQVSTLCLDRGRDNLGEEVIRPYTPITLDSDVGYFELVIKVRAFIEMTGSCAVVLQNIKYIAPLGAQV